EETKHFGVQPNADIRFVAAEGKAARVLYAAARRRLVQQPSASRVGEHHPLQLVIERPAPAAAAATEQVQVQIAAILDLRQQHAVALRRCAGDVLARAARQDILFARQWLAKVVAGEGARSA